MLIYFVKNCVDGRGGVLHCTFVKCWIEQELLQEKCVRKSSAPDYCQTVLKVKSLATTEDSRQ